MALSEKVPLSEVNARAKLVRQDGVCNMQYRVLARRDGNGYFKITGRIKAMIIQGGENIYPKEIEDFLYTSPLVKDVQVIGVPDLRYDEGDDFIDEWGFSWIFILQRHGCSHVCRYLWYADLQIYPKV